MRVVPSFEAETPFGTIAALRPNSGLRFGVSSLVKLLQAYNPETDLARVDPSGEVFCVPDRPELILRWRTGSNTEDPDFMPRPTDFDALVEHDQIAEKGFNRLRQLGMPMLRRTIFVVESDPHDKGRASTYTIVQRYGSGETLQDKINEDPANPHTKRTVRHVGQVFIRYFNGIGLGDPFFHDLGFKQCATDGTLYDYDAYLSRNPRLLAEEIEYFKCYE